MKKEHFCSPQTISEFCQSTNESWCLSNLGEKTKYWHLSTISFHQIYSGNYFILEMLETLHFYFSNFTLPCITHYSYRHSLVVIFNSSLVILTIYLYSVFCLERHSFTSTVMFKLQHYKNNTKDMVVEYIRDKAHNELTLHVAVYLHNCSWDCIILSQFSHRLTDSW